jgi:hypothetical protein
MKRQVRDIARPDSKLEEVRQLSLDSLAGIEPEMIRKFFKHVENVEDEFRVKEGVHTIHIEPIIIPFEDFEDSDSDSDAEIDAEIDVVGL